MRKWLPVLSLGVAFLFAGSSRPWTAVMRFEGGMSSNCTLRIHRARR